MVTESELQSLLFFDLETSSEYSTFDELMEKNPRKANLWITKAEKASVKDPERWKDYKKSYTDLSPLSAEFGRIVCGSFCYVIQASTGGSMAWQGKMKSFYDTLGDDTSEKAVLKNISDLLYNIDRAGKAMRLCGHNIKKFDLPWLTKRMIVNKVPVPPQLQLWGKKPWEITHLDTSEMWSMGVWDNYTSLDLLSCSLDVPSPKADMAGEYVGKAFWEEKAYTKIAKYCEEDVKCVARICHTLSGSSDDLIF
jgi:DNA polymerase elongation subunit (family B)